MRYIPLLILLSALIIYKSLMTTTTIQPVVVVGSGLAGLTATYTLLKRHIPVILLEKSDKVGGNSIKASSGINGAWTSSQKLLGIEDSDEALFQDTRKSGGDLGWVALQQDLAMDSAKAIEWLKTDIGVGLNVVNRLGGHSQRRTHRSDGIPPGFEIISKLYKKVQAMDGLEVRMNSKLENLDVEDLQVRGVQYVDLNTGEVKAVKTNNVIMATGGFGFSKELLQRYRPEFASLPTTNGNGTLGEGQMLLEKIGAKLVEMDQIQIHPTGFIKQDDRDNNWKFLAAESLRGVGGVLLNSNLDRFIDELTTRDRVSEAILQQEGQSAYLVLSEEMYKEFQFQIDFYMKMNLISRTTLADMFHDQAGHALEVLAEYSTTEDHEHPRDHKAHLFDNLTESTPLYIGEVTPVVHYTMGGVDIGLQGEVMTEAQDVFKGLYAAGEVSGGLHGQNRLGGNSLLECVVFGTKAGNHVVV